MQTFNRLLSVTVTVLALFGSFSLHAQIISQSVIDKYSPSVVREAFDIIGKIESTEQQQVAIAEKIQAEDRMYVDFLKQYKGFIPNDGKKEIRKFRKKWMKEILSEAQIAMYWRGVYDHECKEKADKIAYDIEKRTPGFDASPRKQTAMTLRQIFLECKVIEETYVKQKKIDELENQVWDKWLKILEEKSGWRISRDLQATDVWKTDRRIPRMD